MNDNGHPLDRRRLLAGAAAASAVTVTGLAVASTGAAAAAAPARPATPLIARDRIATAALRAPDGSAPAVGVQTDFHARLAAWLAFWSANSPPAWSTPVHVVARVEPAGDALVLHAIRHRRDDELHAGFAAGRRDATHLATLASLHHHFRTCGSGPDGHDPGRRRNRPGFTGRAGAGPPFAVAACRETGGADAAAPPRPVGRKHAARGARPAPGNAPKPPRTPGWAAFPEPACVAGWARIVRVTGGSTWPATSSASWSTVST
ncbi:translation initiation factor IF-2 [Micromonospora sp. M42]|uniref:hypothetical protein n=1 Tax=Micromonospora sp. M42 TaxID=457406 RepID=UPI0003EECB37|nr:hypothetical protein [Micromonospora sp. M42]EWM65722.1 translation initiation factor IF-2 [Micromonospora sp. M42]